MLNTARGLHIAEPLSPSTGYGATFQEITAPASKFHEKESVFSYQKCIFTVSR